MLIGGLWGMAKQEQRFCNMIFLSANFCTTTDSYEVEEKVPSWGGGNDWLCRAPEIQSVEVVHALLRCKD